MLATMGEIETEILMGKVGTCISRAIRRGSVGGFLRSISLFVFIGDRLALGEAN